MSRASQISEKNISKKQANGDRPIWKIPTSVRIALFSVFVFTIFFVLWGNFANITGAVVAQGEVEVQELPHAVERATSGVVSQIMVNNGDLVKAGDPLFTLESEELLAENGVLKQEVADLLALEARIYAELNGTTNIVIEEQGLREGLPQDLLNRSVEMQYEILKSNLRARDKNERFVSNKIKKINSQKIYLDKMISNNKKRLDVLQDEVNNLQYLKDKGMAKNSQITQIDTQIGTLDTAIIRDQQSLETISAEEVVLSNESDVESAKYKSNLWKELDLLQPKKSSLQKQLFQNSFQLDALTVRAPLAGTVHDIKLEGTGSTLKANFAAMYIVPNSAPTVVIARLNVTDIDQAYPGQPARIRIVPFNARSSHFVEGVVDYISADTKIDPLTKKPYYEAMVKMDLQSVPESERTLIAGMPSQVFLETTSRTPISFLMQPITRYFQKVMIEG